MSSPSPPAPSSLWPPDMKSRPIGKDPDAGRDRRQRRRGDRGRRAGCITDSMDMTLSKLWDAVEDGGVWAAAAHGVRKPHALFEGGGERIHIVLVPLKGTTVGDPTRELKYSCTWLYSAWLPRAGAFGLGRAQPQRCPRVSGTRVASPQWPQCRHWARYAREALLQGIFPTQRLKPGIFNIASRFFTI